MHNLGPGVQAVALETYGGLVTLARPENVPEGASPRNYDIDYLIGSAQTRAPLQSVYSYEDADTGARTPDAAVNTTLTGKAWQNPTSVFAGDGSYATCNCAGGSDALDVTSFALDLEPTVTPIGLTVTLTGFTQSAVTLTAQLLKNGVPVGTAKQAALPSTNTSVILGGPTDLWGTTVTSDDANNVGFGVRITADSSFPGAQALIDAVTLDVSLALSSANFNFITTFTAYDGSVKNLSIDANGGWWVEDVTNNPGELSLLPVPVTPGSFASAVNGPGVEYFAFTDLTTGSDLPRQYTPEWIDRISQVGPGAAPVFAVSTNAAGTPAVITAFAVSGDVVTLTADNSFSAGQPVLFSGLTPAAFLNGQTLVVLGSGLSGTQFEVAFTHADVGTTADSGKATPQTNYPIATITQPAAQSRGFSYFLQSTGPGSTSPGNVITAYYSDSTTSSADQDLVDAFNSGNAVYLYFSFTGTPVPFGPLTVQVTSVGLGSPPDQPRQFYYFTFTTTNAAAYTLYAGSGHSGYTANYQRTLATMTTSEPVPVLGVGSSATIAGTSVSNYDSTWPIAQALNSGAMAITQTSLTGGVATYSYTVVSGANPTAEQLVTITGTLNANGMLNGADLVIAGVIGTNQGTFTVNGFSSAQDYPVAAEQGQATTAGTEFSFDPGLETLGSSTSPIYGASSGGYLIFAGNGQYLSAGTKQGVVFFITRNGYWTTPSAPVTFSIPENSTAILASQIPIGPPNVVARGIAFTESGANNVPGANFFTLPTPQQYIVNGVTYTASSLFVMDNTSTTASFSFPDSELLQAEAIDQQGNDLFNLLEIGNPGWIAKYASRNAYGLCQNKVQNFVNLSFDGGYLPGVQLTPLGWTAPDQYGELLVSPIFGNSYYIKNSTTGTLAMAGMIAQAAYQDAYQQPILAANTGYSVRVTARAPSGLTTGSLVVDLVANGVSYGSFTTPFANLTTAMQTLTGTLLTNGLATVPGALQVRAYASGAGAGADVEIDRVELFPTAVPVLSTTVFFSYANDLESVDAVTGGVVFDSENQQPVNGAKVLYDTFYGLKGSSMYSLQSSPNLEPAQWNEPEVAQKVGTCGINAYDQGEQWLVTACRNGLYLFEGGQPGKIMEEILQIWNAINWRAGKAIWVTNDVVNRRLYVGVPLPTPNFWLPDAPANPAPSTPNVVLMMNYQGLDTAEAIKGSPQMHTTMFGALNAIDMRRKWSIWQIQSPYGAVVSSTGQAAGSFATGEVNILDGEMRFCNGIASSKVYRLNTELGPKEIPTDDGAPLNSLYTTYGWVAQSKAAQMPMLGLFRKLWGLMTHQISGAGTLKVRLLPNVLLGPDDDDSDYYPWTLPGGFVLTDPCTRTREAPLNFAGTRTFLEFSTTGRMDLSDVVLVGRKHPHNQLTGQR
jgi:hypothetical protein